MSEFITVSEFRAKFSSKLELDKFLRDDYKGYLPAARCMTEYFYKDLILGKKKVSFISFNRNLEAYSDFKFKLNSIANK